MAISIYSIYHGQVFLGKFYVNSLGEHRFSVKLGSPSNILSKSYCQYPDVLSEREAIDTFLAENGIDPDECFITPLNRGNKSTGRREVDIMKKLNFVAYLACILLAFFVIRSAQAQTMEQIQQVPGRVAGPAVFNNGIVLPLQNINPFQYSDLDSSTLDQGIEQKSNTDLNQPTENRSEVIGSEVSERTSQTMERESEANFVPLSLPTREPIYMWTDKKGTTHFTNLIKSVPLEFRDQAIKGAEKLQKETRSNF